MARLFDCFQVVALLTLAGLFIGRSIYTYRTRKAPPITFRFKDRRNILTVSLFAAMTAWLIVALVCVFRPYDLPSALSLELVGATGVRAGGLAVTVLGLALYVVAILALGESWRVGDPRRRVGLVTNGVYSLSRNPIYLSFMLLYFGVFLIDGALVLLIFAILLTLNVHFLIIEEEAWLAARYGAAFRAYRAATGRYLTRHRTPGAARLSQH
jgi:protein-S-isoprenylcysteine O-methyltransferase Ste14